MIPPRLLPPSLLSVALLAPASAWAGPSAPKQVQPAPAAKPAPSVPAPTPPAPRAPRAVELRVGFSAAALRTLAEARVRRLIEIETEDVADLAPGMLGPLGDRVAFVWIDQPATEPPNGSKPPPSGPKIIVEVRAGDRPVMRREIAVRGLAGDVTARLVALAVSEMVRAGRTPRPAPPPPPALPRPPTPEEQERAARSAVAVFLAPQAVFAGLPGARGVLGGAGLALGFRAFGASESIYARWVAGSTAGTALRWLEVGLTADYRIWLGRSFRLALGGQAALASAHLDGLGIGAELGQRESWSARAGGLVALEARLASGTWLALDLEPGAILRPVAYTAASGSAATLHGAWLGAGISLRLEHVREAAPSPGAPRSP